MEYQKAFHFHMYFPLLLFPTKSCQIKLIFGNVLNLNDQYFSKKYICMKKGRKDSRPCSFPTFTLNGTNGFEFFPLREYKNALKIGKTETECPKSRENSN